MHHDHIDFIRLKLCNYLFDQPIQIAPLALEDAIYITINLRLKAWAALASRPVRWSAAPFTFCFVPGNYKAHCSHISNYTCLLFGGYYIFTSQQSINQLADMLIRVAASYYVEAI